jgi:hypothetical protein
MQRHRFIEARVAVGHSAVAFPGSPMPEPGGGRGRWVSSGASLLIHGGALFLLFLLSQLAPEELKETLIEVTRVNEPKEEPAPRPRAIAESAGRFDPRPMAMAPQILNPTVIQQRVPDLAAAQVQVRNIQPVQAPREIAPIRAPDVSQARQFQSPIVANTAAPRVIDTAAPQLSGPVDFQAPTGTLAGPRQVTTGGTVGIADPSALGTGSSVREGIASDRDVHGAKTGERASVNVAVGSGGGRGTGGDGTGAGGAVSFEACVRRPEVEAYLAHVKDRMKARWALPGGVAPNQGVQLRFHLDPSGSANQVEFVNTPDAALGRSAVEAIRAASPFNPMSERVRCLSNASLTAIFSNPQ